jgi:probable selenium-dependent hydroxylase accessory protein YqeC
VTKKNMIREQRATTLTDALALRPREHIALVGAGGKTTLLFALSGELQGLSRKVLTSTTTKVWYGEARKADSIRLAALGEHWREGVRKDIEEGRSVFLGLQRLESGKVQGIDPFLLDALFEEEDLDCLLVEADGSAGHPVKAPSGKEPVIPDSATTVLAVTGVEALGRPFTSALVFREDAFEAITRIAPGETITSLPLSRLFIHPDGLFRFTPPAARKVVLLNKTDLPHDREQVRELTHLILADCRMQVDRVVVGSLRKGEWDVFANQKSEVSSAAGPWDGQSDPK